MDLLQELYSVLRDNHTIAYSTISATALLLYETIVTSSQEINLVWRSPLSFVNVMHILIRYYSLIFLLLNSYVSINTFLSQEFCGTYDVFQIWGTVTLLPAVDTLILIRVYALFERSTKIGVILILLWLAETISLVISIHFGFHPSKADMPNPLPGILPGCFPISNSSYRNVISSGAIATAFQAVYLALTLYILFQNVRPVGLVLSPILKVFFRDGAAYCTILLVMYLLNTLLVRFENGPLQGVGEVWVVSVLAVTAGRLVLNLKDSADLSSDGNFSSFDHDAPAGGRGRGEGTGIDWRLSSGLDVALSDISHQND